MGADECKKYYYFASAQYRACDWKKAAEAFWTVCSKDRYEPKNWYGLAASLQQLGEYKRAIEAWKIAAKLTEEMQLSDPSIYFHQAECYISLGFKNEAKDALEEARKSENKNKDLTAKVELLLERNGL